MSFWKRCRFATALLALAILADGAHPAWAQSSFNVLTRSYNNQRTGANTSETTLNVANVNSQQFGKLFTLPVDDEVYAAVLYVWGLQIAGGTHNVVFVATMNNTVYAFDADALGAPLWSRNFNGSGRPQFWTEVGNGCTNFDGNIGILSTPVIDGVAETMYFVTRTVEAGNTVQRLRAVDINSGNDRANSPQVISVTNTTNMFNPLFQNQRSALALSQGSIYIAWASFCDAGGPYAGWVMNYDATSLAQSGVFSVAPLSGAGGIWMGGATAAFDAGGNAYFATGNGDWDGASAFGESLIKLAPQSLSVLDFFTPSNWATLNSHDDDYGSGGPTLLPGTNLVVQGGKEGKIFLLNSSNLGHEASGDVQVPQFFQAVDPTIRPGVTHHIHNANVAWNSPQGLNLYVWGENDYLHAFRFNPATQTFNLPAAATGAILPPIGMPGGMMTLSANGSQTGSGVLWASLPRAGDAENLVVPGSLYAFNAETLALLWSSGGSGNDSLNFSKGSIPVVANGKVYVGSTSKFVNVYGLTLGGVAVQNVALNKPATSSTPCTVNEGPSQAFNGSVSNGLDDKWCSSDPNSWLMVDLGASYTIQRFVVEHAGAGGESFDLNTSAFNIQVSPDGVNFTTVVNATGNIASITTHDIPGTAGRFVRVNIVTPTQNTDPSARIYEFQVFATQSSSTQPDFQLSVAPQVGIASVGGAANYPATVVVGTGFSDTVNLSVSGLPAGAAANFTPPSLTASGSSTLNISTTASTPPGTYPLTISGASSAYQHSANVILNVNSWYNTAWASRKALTINHTAVSGAANLTGYPLLFSVTDPNMRTVANGGRVGNVDGSDIFFTAADGVTKLNHELESYNPATGQVMAWVQIPVLSSSIDTVAYVYFGNTGVGSQANPAGVWDSNFQGVWHFANGATLSVADSTSNVSNGVNSGMAATVGQIDGAASLNGSSYMIIPPASYPGYPNTGSASSYAQTTEVWFKTASSGAILGQDDGTAVGSNPGGHAPALYVDTNGKLRSSFFNHGLAGAQVVSAGSYNDNNWHQAVDVYNNGTESLYVDGALAGSQTFAEFGYSNIYSYSFGVASTAGWPNGNIGWFYWIGALDELRISNAARSSDWIRTEYNNQNSPFTFFAVGALENSGVNGPPVAAPTFSVPGGSYSAAQSVTLNTTTAGATIRYTTDGSIPTETAGTLYNNTPIAISSTTTLQAIAYAAGMSDSPVTSATYTLTAAAPTFSVPGGTYSMTQNVTLSTATTGASIRYTTDGSTPTETGGTLYNNTPIVVSTTTTVKAIAYAGGMTDSAISSVTYTLVVAAPSFSMTGGSYSVTQNVTLSTTTTGASIRYTTDGSTPTETAGTLYTNTPIAINNTATLKAIAYAAGLTDSPISSATYTITGKAWYSTAWTNRKVVTINHTGVSGVANLTSFPLLFSVTDPNMRTVANGGGIGNGDGSDIVFTAADGVTKLNHEIGSYNPASGHLVAWVQIPVLSPSADSVLYVYYGNAGVTNQANPSGVWDSNFQGVWHFANGTTLSVADSTLNANNGSNSGMAATVGRIDGAAGFNGSSYMAISSASYPGYPKTGNTSSYIQTTEVWFQTATSGAILGQDDGTAVGSTPGTFVAALYVDTDGKLRSSFFYHGIPVSQNQIVTTASYNDNQWHHVVDVFDSGAERLYVDGILGGARQLTEFSYSNVYAYALGAADTSGWPNGNSGWLYWNGAMDELRISNAARSSDWIRTEYNNQSSPATFVVTGSQEASGAGGIVTAAPTFSVPGGTYSAAQSVSLSTTTAGASIRYTIDGSTPSETLGVLYNNTPIAIGSTTTVKAIAYAAGMTDSPISSATYTIVSGTGPSWYDSAWSSRKAVTINHTAVSGATNLASFPLLFSVTDPNLKSIGNGGGVGNPDGSDILFTAADGVTRLNHEVELYNASTGQLIAWVQIPVLSPSADTTLFVYYGNAGVANQSNPMGVWDSNFKGVWHFANGATLSVADSTSNANNGTGSGVSAAAGQIDGAAGLNGAGFMMIPQASYPGFPAAGSTTSYAQTTEVWFKTAASGAILGQDDGKPVGTGPGGWVAALYVDSTGKLRASLYYHGPGGAGLQIVTAASYNDNQWHHVVDTYNSGVERLYVDGVLAGSQTQAEYGYSATYGYSLGAAESSGWPNGNSGWLYWNGALDELRISNAARSSDWVKTEYNNQSSPATFFAVGPQQGSGGGPPVAAPAFSVPGGSYSAAQSVSLSTTTAGASIRYTIDGSTPSETLGVLYNNTPVAINATTTLQAIAYAAGMTDSPISSATYTITLPVAAAPTFSVPGGTYSAAQSVSLSTTTAGASIRYTIDGSTPSETLGVLYNNTPVAINATTTLQAIAYAAGMTDSPISSATYTITLPVAAAPTFSVPGGTYSAAQSVSLSTTTAGASIRYTIDGSTPSETLGVLYNNTPIAIGSTTTVKAIAYAAGMTDSPISSATYTITLPVAAAPTFSVPGGTYSAAQSVSLSTTTAGASIRYTIDGSTPSETLGVLYNNTPIAIGSTTTVKAIAYAAGMTDSPISSATYTITLPVAAAPTFSVPGGTYSAAQSVSLSTTTAGASIRYTIDGSTPSETLGVLYNNTPIAIGSTTTVKAIAYAAGMTDSPISSATYTITLPVAAAPTFSVPGGTYSAAQSVSLSTTTAGASIRYTIDGSTPSETLGVLYNNTPIAIGSTTTVKAIAYAAGMTDSPISSATYTITLPVAAAPTFSVPGGTYSAAQSVSLSTTTAGASIRYTIDGSTPSETLGVLYNNTPIAIGSTTTVKAIAYAAGMTDSPISSATYTIVSGTGPSWYDSAWSSRKAVTINHTAVSGATNLASFPLLFSVTDPNLKSIGNGGGVGNPDGSDILFTAADGVTRLNHEVELYNASTGQLIAWVQIPVLSPSADTTLFVYYGNAGVANQSNPMGVWDSNFKGVWHFANGATLSVADSTSNANNGTGSGVSAAAGQIDGAAGLNGAGFMMIPQASYPGFPAAGSTTSYAQTTEVWFKTAASGAILGQDDGKPVGTGPGGWVAALYVDSTGKLRASLYYHGPGGAGLQIVTAASYNDNQWHHVVDTYNSGVERLYVDGVLAGSQTQAEYGYSATYGYSLGAAESSGWPNGNSGWLYWNGALDELRISNAARSSDWVKTEYNNQSSPATFFAVGPQQGSGGGPPVAAPAFSVPGGSYSAAQSVSLSTTTAGASIRYTIDGSTPSETLGVLYNNTPVAINATTTLQAIAYAAGMTDSPISSATYTITLPVAAAPTFSVPGGTYSAAQSVSLSTTTAGASIRYTIDGSTPSETLGVLYNNTPVAINATTTLQAIAYAAGMTDSPISSATYTITLPVAAAPTFSVPGGTYSAAQSVSLSTTTAGASIRYTIDGSTPSETLGVLYNNTPIAIGSTTTVKAIAYAAGMTDSPISSATYTITLPVAAAPTFSVPGGTYSAAQSVSLSTTTAGASIRYTIDGSTPSETLGVLYNNTPIAIGSTTTVKAIAYAAGMTDSPISSATYTITLPVAAAPTFSVPGGTYSAAQSVSLSTTTAGASIRYTIDGSTPSETLGVLYNNTPIAIGSTTTVKAIAYAAGMTDSPISSATYTITLPVAAAPTFSVPGGTYSAAQSVSLSTTTAGASIRYTIDGSTPSETLGVLYNNTPIAIGSTTTVKAIAYAAGMTDSPISSATYTITLPVAAAPTFSVPGGTYSAAQSVSLSTTTAGASIRYTIDGSTPSETLGVLYNNTPIAIGSTTTVKAIAYAAGMTDSPISSATYTIVSGTGPSWYDSAWSSRKAVTINHTAVSGATNLASFPLLFSVTDPNLKSIGNGGGVGNPDGSDILFTAADGVTRLNHEVELYNASTGQLIAWVQIPVLSPSADTTLFVYYGNAGVANQSNPMGVWDSNFKGVWHFANGATLSVADSTSNANNGTGSGVSAAAGQIDGAAGLNGAGFMMIPQASYPGFPAAGSTTSYAQTTEVWFKTAASGAILGQDDGKPVGTGPGGWVAALYVDSTGKLRASLYYHGPGGAGLQIVTAASYNDNQWHHVVDTYNSGVERLYVDGVLAGSQTQAEYGYSATYGYSLGAAESSGWPNGNSGWLYWNGALDELRISNAARSSDWVKTEYNNQSSPATFFAVGPQQGSGGGPPVAAPAFSVPGGSYSAAQSVSLSTTTAGASIRYTIDGSTPSETLGVLYNNTPVAINATTTLQAIAYAAGMTDSPISSATYTITLPVAAAPTFSVPGGTYSAAQSVSLSTTTAGASIRYTIDGSTPSETLGVLYNNTPVAINATTTLQAIAYAAGMTDSPISSATYTITLPVAAAPTFSVPGGTYSAAQSVSLSTTTAGASIRYTIDGSTPSETLGVLYNNTPIAIGSTTTVKAIAYAAGMTDSPISSATYTITLPVAAAPTFSVPGGTYSAAQSVSLSTTTAGASIRYTIDGSTPSETLGVLYNNTPIAIGSTTTVKAIAYAAGMTDSPISSATYTITLPVAAAPTFSVPGGTYSAAQSVSLSTTTAGASIRYTIDGSTPSETLGVLYNNTPIAIGSTTTVKAIAYAAGMTDSPISSATYTITLPVAAAPTFSVPGGTYSAAQSVSLSTTTAGASIRYTIDGSTPSETLGVLYNNTPIAIGSTTTVKAIAYAAGMTDSPISSATYTIVSGTGPSWYDSAWSSRKAVTINHTAVSGATNLASFPLLFSVTDPNLKSIGNGGGVGNPDGSDILFTAADGVTRLNHEVELYNASTGQLIAWVQIPVLSPSADTTLFVYYGNAGVANQSNPMGVWDSNFKGVWHFANGATLSVADSTSNANNGTGSGVSAAAGQIDGAAGLNGAGFMMIPQASYPGFPAAGSTTSYAQTTEVWFKTAASGAILGQDDGKPVGTGPGGWVAALYVDSTGKLRASLYYHGPGGAGLQIVTAASYNDNQWHHVVDTYNSGVERLYVDGVLAGSQTQAEYGYSATYGYSLGAAESSGWPNGNSGWLYWNGALDELRISNAARSSDWVKTEYNNQSSPATFFAVGPQQGSGG